MIKVEIDHKVREILENAESPAFACVDLMKHGIVRMNESTHHIIFYAHPVPKLPGFRDTEVVIGIRPTSFQPYVAWLSFEKIDYAYGDYCQTLDGAIACAQEKLDREFRYGK